MSNITRVFISSTSRDLSAYRQKAIDVCLRFDFHPLAMEYFEAMDVGATAGSLRKLDEADVYIGIFAHRYGYIEPGHDKAVTELEFEHAIERGLGPLCFLVDSQYPWPPDAIDFQNKAALDKLKDRIEKYYIRGQFTSVDDFAVKLTQALVGWQREHGIRITQLKEILPSKRLMLLPPRPPLLMGRDQDMAVMKGRLEKPEKIIVIRGWPGIGKTTFIQSLAYDEGLESRFPDGVLWASVGTQPDLYGELKAWATALGKDTIGLSVQEAVQHIKGLIASKRILIIADDIWDETDAQVFRQVLGPHCALIVTTRADGIARKIADGSSIHYLNRLTDDQSFDLVRRLAPAVTTKYPGEMMDLVKDLEGSPLSLKIAARLLDNELRLQGNLFALMQDIREGRALLNADAPADRRDAPDPETGTTPTTNALLRQSTERLEPDVRRKFALLGTLAPKPATFDGDAIRFIWNEDDPLPAIRALVDWGLLEPLPTIARFQMHALLVKHAKELLHDEAALNAPARVHRPAKRSYLPMHPDVDANTPEPYKQIYLKPLYLKLEMLKRDLAKGKPVNDEIEMIRAEIQRLGHNPDKRGM